MTWKEFKPQCVGHTEKIVMEVDLAYTDEQLETVLLNECISYKEFPHSNEFLTSFKKHRACQDFASKLAAARDEELRNGSKKGYTNFCAGYFKHHGGVIPGKAPPKKAAPAPEPKKSKGVSVTFVVVSVCVSIIFVLVAYCLLRQ